MTDARFPDLQTDNTPELPSEESKKQPNFAGEVWSVPAENRTAADNDQLPFEEDGNKAPAFADEVWAPPSVARQQNNNPFANPPERVAEKKQDQPPAAPKDAGDRPAAPAKPPEVKKDVAEMDTPFKTAPKPSLDAVQRALVALGGVESGKPLTPAQRKAFEDAIKDSSMIDPKWAAEQQQKLTDDLEKKERKLPNGTVLPPWTPAKEEALWNHIIKTDRALAAVPKDTRDKLIGLEQELQQVAPNDIIKRVQIEQRMSVEARADSTGKASDYLKERVARNQFQKDNSTGILRRNIHQQEMTLLNSKAMCNGIFALALEKSGQTQDTKKMQDLIKDAISSNFALNTLPDLARLRDKYGVKENDPLDEKVPGRATLKDALAIMSDTKLSAKERMDKARPLFEQAVGAADRLDVKKIDEEIEKIAAEAARLKQAGEVKKMEELDGRATELVEQRRFAGAARMAFAAALNDTALELKGKDDAASNKHKEDAIKVLQSIERADPSAKYDPMLQGALKLVEQGKRITEEEAMRIGKPIADELKEEAKKAGKDPDADQPMWKKLLYSAGGLIASVLAFEVVRWGFNRTVGAGVSSTRRAVEHWRRSSNVEVDKSLAPGEKPRLFLRTEDGKEVPVEGVRKEDGKLRVKNGDATEITKVNGKLVLKVPSDSNMSADEIKKAAGEILKPTSTEHELDDAAKRERQQQIEMEELRKQSEAMRRQLEGANEGLNEPSRRGLELSRDLKAKQADLKIEGRAQVTQLLRSTLEEIDELRGDKKWSEGDRGKFETLIEEYSRGDAKAVEAVNRYLGIESPAAQTGSSTAGEGPPAKGTFEGKEVSLKDLERMLEAPEKRVAMVRELIEKGPVRETLKKAGVEDVRARRIETELLSEKPEVREKAKLEIAKIYEAKGGVRGFSSELKGRLGALALVAAVVLPFVFVSSSDSNFNSDATWSGGRK